MSFDHVKLPINQTDNAFIDLLTFVISRGFMASRLLRYSALVLILLILQILLDGVRSLDRKYKFIAFAISRS